MAIVEISEFTKKVMQEIRKIPAGRVATYKQIAELAGKPQASRGVAWILHSCSTPHKLPWHRVINSKGSISFNRKSHNFRQQKKRLESERVEVSPVGEVSLEKYRWKKRARPPKPVAGRPQIFSKK